MSPKNTAIDRSDWPDSRELRIPVNLACAASLVRHWQGAGVHSGKSVDLSRRTGGRIPGNCVPPAERVMATARERPGPIAAAAAGVGGDSAPLTQAK
jgi:hypothetical protein